ncbi:low molecular weight phosphotyrosine protein phosphatase [Rhodophyticola sp. CCM32]|uniref:low molecular weight protein-tyrosine-phosphatase n=1 Tax=Rhodophyticola sp. CCM32 TaxID=2916397 RepID=UPI00107F3C4D|nr:low molecular weight protein-tyrosine-phosphatase [Rhodophyticola sp. CCM32]QBY01080.1 low molecular weight phosphotyrosine protein phosphatase [Rhodophyticola sp. CCM32]
MPADPTSLSRNAAPVQRILCVCLGNICRSPTGQGVLQAMLHGVAVDSAGTSNWHIGDAPYAPMQKAALQRGYDLSTQRARQVCPEDFDRFDLILAMDRQNLADLRAIRPEGSKADLALFLAHVKEAPEDVPDSYYTRDFDETLDLIEQGARGWAAQPHIASAVSPKDR